MIRRSNRGIWKGGLGTLMAIGASVLASPTVAAEDPPRPHVVFFLADDLGWKDVGFHGSEIQTPNLDRLAGSGIRMHQFYAQPFCSPTRAALLTGRYPIRYGLQSEVVRPWSKTGLSLEERTLAEALQEAGYFTAILGKWHLGSSREAYLPRRRGFDHHYGHYIGALDYFTHRRMGGLDWRRNGEVIDEEGYTTTLLADEAVELITNHNPDEPLFLYFAFNAPHGPLQAPEEAIERYADSIPDEDRRTYAAMVTRMDHAIGRVVEALDSNEMRGETLILFASDNGGMRHSDNSPLRGGKGDLYEGGVRVPAFAVWPERLPAGRRVDAPLHIVDWYPTLIRLAGGSVNQELPIDGKDLWATLTEGSPSPHKELLLNSNRARGRGVAQAWSGLRRGNWKIVVDRRKPETRTELFHLTRDPYEQQDLSGEHPERLAALQERLSAYEEEAVPPLLSGPRPSPAEAPEVWGPTD